MCSDFVQFWELNTRSQTCEPRCSTVELSPTTLTFKTFSPILFSNVGYKSLTMCHSLKAGGGWAAPLLHTQALRASQRL